MPIALSAYLALTLRDAILRRLGYTQRYKQLGKEDGARKIWTE